jgi:choline dehydrogenase-like flavoprotein
MSQEAYDIVIVGAGAAGCVVASYLAEYTDASIALIEAGDMDRDPFIHIPAGFANMLVHDRHVWKYETVPQHGTKRAYRSGKLLGGGSSINAMCYVRGQIRDFAAWQDAVGDTGKWSYEDLLPVFMAQEHNDTFHDEYHGINGGLAVQLPKGINELNQYCLKAFQECGIPYNPDYNGESQNRRLAGAVNGRKSAAVQRGRRLSASAPRLRPRHSSHRQDRRSDSYRKRAAVGVELIVVLQPKSRGWVRLADSGPTSMPLINPNFIGEEEDLRAAVESVRAIREVMAQESLAPVIEEEMDPGPHIQSDAEIGEWVKRVVTTMWHPVGTCRMGQDARAVVDARLRVRGIDGLRVIDASIMPNITSGNTNAPTQALARHATAMLVEDLKRKA